MTKPTLAVTEFDAKTVDEQLHAWPVERIMLFCFQAPLVLAERASQLEQRASEARLAADYCANITRER